MAAECRQWAVYLNVGVLFSFRSMFLVNVSQRHLSIKFMNLSSVVIYQIIFLQLMHFISVIVKFKFLVRNAEIKLYFIFNLISGLRLRILNNPPLTCDWHTCECLGYVRVLTTWGENKYVRVT